jgi:cryptochrome
MSAIHWLRKGLRLHANPALLNAIQHVTASKRGSSGNNKTEEKNTTNKSKKKKTNATITAKRKTVYALFILDPRFRAADVTCGRLRWHFLWDALRDLDAQLRSSRYKARLYVAHGAPQPVLQELCARWNCNHITWERDTEPYALRRDAAIEEWSKANSISTFSACSHTLYEPKRVLQANGGKLPGSYRGFLGVLEKKLGAPPQPVDAPAAMPNTDALLDLQNASFNVPATVDALMTGIASSSSSGSSSSKESKSSTPIAAAAAAAGAAVEPLKYPGGETVALARLQRHIDEKQHWVCSFEKPKTSPNALEPSTTVLSPYLKFGCLSARLFYARLQRAFEQNKKATKKTRTKPPVSLDGQLLWREYFYTASFAVGANFGRMRGNALCRQIPWQTNAEHLRRWELGQTGFPFIDACMNQLRVEGWLHHLARHAVACFLTRGDLFLSWTDGARVFDRHLLDGDYALNNANWMWLSASAFFSQYWRVYSPVAFGKKTDKSGAYIRKYVPVLAAFPDKYIYEPWTAPRSIQLKCKCTVGVDYPKPMVDHAAVKQRTMAWMKQAFARAKQSKTAAGAEAGAGGAAAAAAATRKSKAPSAASQPSIADVFRKKAKKGTTKDKKDQ